MLKSKLITKVKDENTNPDQRLIILESNYNN